MKVNSINNNQNIMFKSKFVQNRNLALAFDNAERTCSKQFLKSMNAMLKDGKDRLLRLDYIVTPTRYPYPKDSYYLSAHFHVVLNSNFLRPLDRSAYVKDVVHNRDDEFVRDYKKSVIGCTLVEGLNSNVKDEQVDKLSKKEVLKNIQAVRKEVFKDHPEFSVKSS